MLVKLKIFWRAYHFVRPDQFNNPNTILLFPMKKLSINESVTPENICLFFYLKIDAF